MIIEPEFLHDQLSDNSDFLLVDVGDPQRYSQAHIPGAVNVSPAETQAGPPFPGYLPEKNALKNILSRIGYDASKNIIVYDDEGGGWAGRFIWILDSIGHQQYQYLNGGIVAWHGLGLPLEQGTVSVLPSQVDLEIDEEPTISRQALEHGLSNNEFSIWDARSPGEYDGSRVNAARGGHIPGAKNLEWTSLMDRNNHLKLLPEEQIRKLLMDAGLGNAHHIVTHCQSHHRSGLTYLVAKWLGYESVKAYAGSWGEWGNLPDTPVETNI